MAVSTIAQRSGMLDFRFLDLLCLISVAGDAQLPGTGLRENDLAVFGRLMAGAARSLASLERSVNKSLHQAGAA